MNFTIALYCTVSKSPEKIYINKYSLYPVPNLLLPHNSYLLEWDSDQHESFGYFGHCAHINKLVYYIYFSLFVK